MGRAVNASQSALFCLGQLQDAERALEAIRGSLTALNTEAQNDSHVGVCRESLTRPPAAIVATGVQQRVHQATRHDTANSPAQPHPSLPKPLPKPDWPQHSPQAPTPGPPMLFDPSMPGLPEQMRQRFASTMPEELSNSHKLSEALKPPREVCKPPQLEFLGSDEHGSPPFPVSSTTADTPLAPVVATPFGVPGSASEKRRVFLAGAKSSETQHRVALSWETIDCQQQANVQKAVVDQVIIDALVDPKGGSVSSKENAYEGQGETQTSIHSLNGSALLVAEEKRFFDDELVWIVTRPSWPKWPMLHPDAKVRTTWIFLGLLLIVYEAYSIPFYLAFDIKLKGAALAFTAVVNCYFLADVVITFVTGILLQDGHLEVRPFAVARAYLSGWFFCDLIAGFPWEWAVGGGDGKNGPEALTRSVKFVRFFRLMRLTRVLHITKLRPVFEKMEAMSEANFRMMFAIGFLRIIAVLFGLAHWAACAWYVVGRSEKYHPNTWVENFLVSKGITSVAERYMCCFYFTLTTMTTVGYGDVTPQNTVEIGFTVGLLILASFLFSTQMATLADLISNSNHWNHIKVEKKMTLSRYMRWRALPRKLSLSVRQHLIFLWDTNEDNDAYEEELKAKLPPVLRTELCYHIYGNVLYRAPFLSWMTDYLVCVKQLASLVDSKFLEQGDYLFRFGDLNMQIWLLVSGKVWVTRNESLFQGIDLTSASVDVSGNMGVARRQIGRSGSGVKNPYGKKPASADRVLSAFQQAHIPASPFFGNTARNDKGLLQSDVTPDPSPTQVNVTSGLDRSKSFQETWKKKDGASGDTVRVQVLGDAAAKLHDIDKQKEKAALLVQRKWRAKRQSDKSIFSPRGSRSTKSGAGLSNIQSREVAAPAYFGESCLWVPIEDWDNPDVRTPYMYSARCLSRSEFVFIERRDVFVVVAQFSPWLQERLEMFKEHVVGSVLPMMAAGSKSGTSRGEDGTQVANGSSSNGVSNGGTSSIKDQWRNSDDWADADCMFHEDSDAPLTGAGARQQVLLRPCSRGAPS